MKKTIVILASLVLLAGVTFGQDKAAATPAKKDDGKKTEKKSDKKMDKKSDKKMDDKKASTDKK
ncbi:MAG: hypothetical protein ACLQQ4_14805 [Bacteroidia bacterium]